MSEEKFLVALVFLISFFQIAILAETANEEWDAGAILPANYNKIQAPIINGTPVVVKVSLIINRFLEVNVAEETFKVNTYFKQTWRDPRIQFPSEKNDSEPLVLRSSWSDKLWHPSSYFFNAVDGTDLNLLSSPIFYEVSSDGTVTMSSRMIAKLTCNMQLALYPHDTQTCHIRLESLSDAVKEVRYVWETFEVVQREGFHGFLVDNLRPEEGCHEVDGSHRENTCIMAVFALHRQLGHYLIRVYGPSFLIVITTFIGFWIPAQGYPARTLIVVLPLLALITQQSQVNNEMIVSYVVALDVWYMVCSVFIFMALLELAIALVYCHQVEDKKEQERKASECPSPAISAAESIAESMDTIDNHLHVPKTSLHHQRKQSLPAKLFYFRRNSSYNFPKSSFDAELQQDEVKRTSRMVKLILHHIYGDVDWRKAPGDRNKIDYCSRILFPLVYVIFCLCYFFVIMR